jgi:hypothetical protein
MVQSIHYSNAVATISAAMRHLHLVGPSCRLFVAARRTTIHSELLPTHLELLPAVLCWLLLQLCLTAWSATLRWLMRCSWGARRARRRCVSYFRFYLAGLLSNVSPPPTPATHATKRAPHTHAHFSRHFLPSSHAPMGPPICPRASLSVLTSKVEDADCVVCTYPLPPEGFVQKACGAH